MIEPELPITLTFEGKAAAYDFIVSLDHALEDVNWEQRKTEDGTVLVTILGINSLEEEKENE